MLLSVYKAASLLGHSPLYRLYVVALEEVYLL